MNDEPVPTSPRTPPAEPLSNRTQWVIIAAFVALIALCGTAWFVGSRDGNDSSDASARMACRHFRNVAGDIADGTLTGAEARQKFVEINDTASVSENAELSSATTALLAAMTRGDEDAAAAGMRLVDAACDKAGL